jgi:hypothetical protein
MLRYKLSTLLVLAAIAPPILAATWWWKDALPELLAGFLIGASFTIGVFFAIVLAIWVIDVGRLWVARRRWPEAAREKAENC